MRTSLQPLALMVKRLQAHHHRAINSELAPLGISLVQWDALRHLHANPGASLHDLAVLTFQTDQSFGALAGRMLARGLIARVSGPGRAVRHRLTDKGERLRRAGNSVVEGVLKESFQPLSASEREKLEALLTKLVEAPELDGESAGGR